MAERYRDDYPFIQTPGSEASWCPIHLYGITGWMTTMVATHGFGETEVATAAAFGGYIRHDPSNGAFEGQLIDTVGPSYIRGAMTENSLTFTKIYTNQNAQPITYRMERGENGWQGEYEFVDRRGMLRGPAACQTTLFHEDAFGILIGPPGKKRYEQQARTFEGLRTLPDLSAPGVTDPTEL